MRGTVDVVTSLCADETAGVLLTSTSESKVCKARPGQSARTTTGNSRVQFGWKCSEKDAEPSALLASETAVGQNLGEFNNENLPSSASSEDHAFHAGFGASVHLAGKRRQQRNRERNSWRPMMEILPIRQRYTWFRNRFGGCLRWTVATKHCIR